MTLAKPKLPPHVSAPDHGKLDRSFISGVAWTGAAKWSTQLFTWAATLVAARLLTPDDYGLVGMGGVYLNLILLMTEFGLGSAIVTLKNLSESQVAQIHTLSVLLGLAGFLISCIVATPLGVFFAAPDLPNIVTVLGFGFIINSFQTVPSALLQKEHRFKALSIIGAIRGVVQSAAVVTFAWLGFRYWSLVLGVLLGHTVGTSLTFMVRRHRLAPPRLSSLAQAMRFSGEVLVSRLSWYAYSNSDFVIAGRLLGKTALGSYNLAWTLAMLPLEKVTTLIGSVTPAFYAAINEDNNALRRYLLRPIEAITLLLFPSMLGLSLVANDAVLAVLGNQWEASIQPLQLLSLYVCVRSIMPLFPQVLTATGDTGFVMWNEIVSMVVLPAALLWGSRWGITGIAAAWVISYPVNALPLYWRVHQQIGLTHREFLRALLPAVNGSVFMVFAVEAVKLILSGKLGPMVGLIVREGPWQTPYYLEVAAILQWLLDGHFGHGVRLFVQIASGASVYVLVVWIFHRKRLLAFRHGIAKIRQ